MEKKRILILTYPIGGPRIWAEELSSQLSMDYDVEMVIGWSGCLKAMFSRTDILHSNIGIPFSYAKKYVLTIHGDFRKEKLIGRLLFPIAIRFADNVTVPSKYLRDQLGINNVYVVPNAITIGDTQKTSYKLLNKNPVIGILTNFHFREKAAGVLLLVGCVRRTFPKSKILVGGDGRYFGECQKEILSIMPSTSFLGYCRKEDLFSKIDIFAYYSLFDNQPIALIEAMGYGLPVITNEVGAVREVMIGPMASYVARDINDYENILSRLIVSEFEREDSGCSAKSVAAHFNWKNVKSRFVEIYDK
jgi:glycosyltransferase involved in cell wall biosynthesis